MDKSQSQSKEELTLTINTKTGQPVSTKKRLISILINSVSYFFEFVLIIPEKRRFRLLVIHKHSILLDKRCRTLKGARISFERYFKEKKVLPEKAAWSSLYNPDPGWLELVLSCNYPRGVFRCG